MYLAVVHLKSQTYPIKYHQNTQRARLSDHKAAHTNKSTLLQSSNCTIPHTAATLKLNPEPRADMKVITHSSARTRVKCTPQT